MQIVCNSPRVLAEVADGFHGFHDAADDSRASEFRHPVEDIEPLPESPSAEWSHALGILFGWITEPHVRSCGAPDARRLHAYVCPRKLGMRTAALIYSLRPDLFPGETAVSLAKKIGVTKQAFAKHVRAFRVTFDLQTRVMRSPAAREAMKQAALKWHRERMTAR